MDFFLPIFENLIKKGSLNRRCLHQRSWINPNHTSIYENLDTFFGCVDLRLDKPEILSALVQTQSTPSEHPQRGSFRYIAQSQKQGDLLHDVIPSIWGRCILTSTRPAPTDFWRCAAGLSVSVAPSKRPMKYSTNCACEWWSNFRSKPCHSGFCIKKNPLVTWWFVLAKDSKHSQFCPRLGFKTMDAFPFLCAVRAEASANGDDGGGLPCDVPTRMCLNKLRDIINATSNCNPGCRMLMVQLKMRIWDIHGANQLGNWPTSSNTFPMSKRRWACNARFLSSSVWNLEA